MSLHPQDPRDPPVTDPQYVQPTPEQWERLMAMDAVLALVQKEGAQTVMSWVIGNGTENGKGPDGIYGLIDVYGRERVVRWTRMAANLVGEDI